MLGIHNWVCSVCGQGLTRKTSARRHNDNLHLGQANIVRPFDYIIGRVNGQFATPDDPSLHRRRQKEKKQLSHNLINSAEFAPVAHESRNTQGYRNVSEQPTNGRVNVASYGQNPVPQTQYRPVDMLDYPRKELEPTSTSDKLILFKRLSYKLYPPEIAEEKTTTMTFLVLNLGERDLLDKTLASLLDIYGNSTSFHRS
jgi:hypothetical protein